MSRADILRSKAKVDAIVLTDPASMRYVSGFTGEGYIYADEKLRLVVTDSRYALSAKDECIGYDVIDYARIGYYKPIMDAVRKDHVHRLGFEGADMTYERFKEFEKKVMYAGSHTVIKKDKKKKRGIVKKSRKKFSLTDISVKASELRYVKTPDEIKLIKKAEAIGDKAFTYVVAEIYKCRHGNTDILKKYDFTDADKVMKKVLDHAILSEGEDITEKKVAALIEYYMKIQGANGLSFDTIAASGINGAKPHAVPSDKVINDGELLTMDFGCIYKGYCSDMTRTIAFGEISDKQKEVYDIVKKAQKKALKKIRPGMSGKKIDGFARKVIEKAGYGKCFGHSLGHSVGLKIHERPVFSPREKTIIESGMVISVEPGIYIGGECGVRIEDLVVITKDGIKNLANSPKKLITV